MRASCQRGWLIFRKGVNPSACKSGRNIGSSMTMAAKLRISKTSATE